MRLIGKQIKNDISNQAHGQAISLGSSFMANSRSDFNSRAKTKKMKLIGVQLVMKGWRQPFDQIRDIPELRKISYHVLVLTLKQVSDQVDAKVWQHVWNQMKYKRNK